MAAHPAMARIAAKLRIEERELEAHEAEGGAADEPRAPSAWAVHARAKRLAW
jgi:hypothetical protein